jgi:hypothetical protein
MKLINVVIFDAQYDGPLPVAFPIDQIKQLSAGYGEQLHIYVNNKRISDHTFDDGQGSFFIEATTQQSYFVQRLHMINHIEALSNKTHDAIHLLNLLYNPHCFTHELSEYEEIFFSKEEIKEFKKINTNDIPQINHDKLRGLLEKLSFESSITQPPIKKSQNKI